MTKEKKKSKLGRHLISISFFTVMGVILGFAMIAFLEWQIPEGIPSSERVTRTCLMLFFLYLASGRFPLTAYVLSAVSF